MTKPRDTQRAKVYKAEGQADPSGYLQDREQFPDLTSCGRYVRRVCGQKRIQDRYPRAHKIAAGALVLHDGGGARRATGGWRGGLWGSARLQLPLWCRNEPTILHELAHALTHSKDQAWHGWEFCECLLALTLYVRGREAHDRLKAAYKANRVRFTAPREKRVLTTEQRAAAIERLQRATGRVPETVAFWGLD